MGEVVTRYHISLDVADKPGVLAQVATVFAEHGVSIDTVRGVASIMRVEGE
jgi:homoserine dehydrogenase